MARIPESIPPTAPLSRIPLIAAQRSSSRLPPRPAAPPAAHGRRLRNPIPAALLPQRLAADAEQLGGAALPAARVGESAADRLRLDFGQQLRSRAGAVGRGRGIE